jgi:hypothetical protein
VTHSVVLIAAYAVHIKWQCVTRNNLKMVDCSSVGYTELKCYFSYLLTPWCRILFEKLVATQLVKNILLYCGTRRFITVFTKARHWILFPLLRSCQKSIQVRGALKHFVTIKKIYGEGLSALCPSWTLQIVRDLGNERKRIQRCKFWVAPHLHKK